MTKTAPICFWEKITMGLKITLANFKLQTILILKPWGYPCTVYIPIMHALIYTLQCAAIRMIYYNWKTLQKFDMYETNLSSGARPLTIPP